MSLRSEYLRDQLSDPGLVGPLLAEIGDIAGSLGRRIRIMEVCGTHTVALRRHGIPSLLPASISLISGPGCPVCVTPIAYVDNALSLVERGEATVATFGDMLKVPGSGRTSLSRYTAGGGVRMVYSPAEILALSESAPGPLVFLGIGFETTIPAVAAVFLEAHRRDLRNLFLYTAFKTIEPALRALLADPDRSIDGFLLPGHVSVILGADAYGFLEGPDGLPGVIAGFEPLDMIYAILLILRQVVEGSRRVENAYPRAVKPGGNPKARKIIDMLTEPRDELWRGLGVIPGSGRGLRDEYRSMDAAEAFRLPPLEDHDPPGCLCGKVIQGKSLPMDCSLFGVRCTPDQPVGPCMVSSEGTCAAHFRYGEGA
jgi:hydrogenase expression/formation protein HypD